MKTSKPAARWVRWMVCGAMGSHLGIVVTCVVHTDLPLELLLISGSCLILGLLWIDHDNWLHEQEPKP